jgi:hypothetical protein
MIKLFLGFQLSTELSIHLNQSILWKEISVIRLSKQDDLISILHESTHYIGTYLPHPHTTLTEIQALEKMIQEKLQIYCPNYKLQHSKILLFPQVLIQ